MNGYRKCTITYRTTKYTSIYTHTHTRSLTQSHRIHTKPPNKQDWKGTWDESNSNGDEWLCFWNTETNLEVDGILSISQWQQQQQSEEKNCVILYSCKIILLVFLFGLFSRLPIYEIRIGASFAVVSQTKWQERHKKWIENVEHALTNLLLRGNQSTIANCFRMSLFRFCGLLRCLCSCVTEM